MKKILVLAIALTLILPILSVFSPYSVDATRKSSLASDTTLLSSDPNPKLLRDGSITRNRMLMIAEAYKTHSWTPTDENVFHGTCLGSRVDTPDIGYEGGWWIPNEGNTGVPYQWGGYSSLSGLNLVDPEDFDEQYRGQGEFAGDIHYAGDIYYLKPGECPKACGVDCSGFVGRCWNLSKPKPSTRSLATKEFAWSIKFDQMRRGDILNLPDEHVMLFKEFVNPERTRIRVYEASAWDWRVNEREYEVKEISRDRHSVTIVKGTYEKTYELFTYNPIKWGLIWLRDHQNPDGSWTYSGRITEESVGLTSMATACFLNYGIDESDPTVEKAVEWILDQQNPEGSITTGTYYAYDTSLAILALIATNNPEYYDEIQNAVDYLIGFQNDEDTGYPESDRYYGGWSYFPGYHWADLSNTQFVLLAFYSAEQVDLDDTLVPASVWNKAEIFLQRCQNREESNPDYSFYDDGGFIYLPGNTIWAGGQSYGSMTAAAVWGFVTCGVSNDDPRMQDAMQWLTNNYHIDQNYPIGNKFLYYYLYCLAKAYVLIDTTTVDGHNWYEEMLEFLIDQQQTDGHWIGTDAREEPDNVATCWALLALETKAEPIVERSLIFVVESPVDLHAYDPLGRHVGINYTTGIVDLEIPDASYSGLGTEPQIISIVHPMAGTYRVELVGRATGSYTLTIEGVVGTTTVYSESYPGTINPGELYASKATVSAIAGPLTIWTTPPEFEGIIDNTPPSITVVTPSEDPPQALQDGVTLEATVSDPSGVDWVKFSIRESDGTTIDPMFESMDATDIGSNIWQAWVDTNVPELPDGHYLLQVDASDMLGNEGSKTVQFSIRNWACLELLPATKANKAGRTMPVKFSLRVFETVDPAKPFVWNEELNIVICEKDHPENILQNSTYGDTARDYRIDPEDELYITNFKTIRKKPTTYVVEIYRKDMLIGSFEFSTVK